MQLDDLVSSSGNSEDAEKRVLDGPGKNSIRECPF